MTQPDKPVRTCEAVVREFVEDVQRWASAIGMGRDPVELLEAEDSDVYWPDLGVTYVHALEALTAKEQPHVP